MESFAQILWTQVKFSAEGEIKTWQTIHKLQNGQSEQNFNQVTD